MQPKLTFVKKNGKLFTKKFKSLSTAKRAILGWRANGGKMAGAIRKPNKKSGYRFTSGSSPYRSMILR